MPVLWKTRYEHLEVFRSQQFLFDVSHLFNWSQKTMLRKLKRPRSSINCLGLNGVTFLRVIAFQPAHGIITKIWLRLTIWAFVMDTVQINVLLLQSLVIKLFLRLLISLYKIQVQQGNYAPFGHVLLPLRLWYITGVVCLLAWIYLSASEQQILN